MSDKTNTNKLVCCADTAGSCFELKIEPDTDSMIDYPHDNMPAMGMLPFLRLCADLCAMFCHFCAQTSTVIIIY